MSIAARTSAVSRRRRCALRAALLLGAAGVATAQYALDAGLGGTRINAPRQQIAVSQPVYSVNRQTGEMVYNRANAFNDPSYNIYQRYAVDRTEYFYAGHSSASTSLETRPGSGAPRTGGSIERAPAAYLPNGARGGGGSGGGGGGGNTLSAPAYSAMPMGMGGYSGGGGMHAGRGSSSLAAPSYKVGGGGRRR